MLISADTNEVWTFRQVDEYSNRVANLLAARGFRCGDVVALFMTNKPKFVAVMLGMAKIGVVAALINTNIKEEVRKRGSCLILEHSLFVKNGFFIPFVCTPFCTRQKE